MSRRVSLGDLAERSAPTTKQAPESEASQAPVATTPAVTEPSADKTTSKRPKTSRSSSTPTTPSSTVAWQRFDAYERKEARLRPDQYGQLSQTAKAIMRARVGKGSERITENTLIRVAIDLLLSRTDDLSGATEVELRSSLGL